MLARPTCTGEVAPVRVVVFGARRSGSSLLVKLLRAQPGILMHGELLHVRDLRDPDDGWAGDGPSPPAEVFNVRRARPGLLLDFVQCHAHGHHVVGFKIFHDHTRPWNWKQIADWCDVCVILRREDQLAQYKSYLLARETGRWKGRSRVHSAEVIDPRNATFVDFKWKRNHWYRTVDDLLKRRQGISVVHLSFEAHLMKRTGPDISDLLGALWNHTELLFHKARRRDM